MTMNICTRSKPTRTRIGTTNTTSITTIFPGKEKNPTAMNIGMQGSATATLTFLIFIIDMHTQAIHEEWQNSPTALDVKDDTVITRETKE